MDGIFGGKRSLANVAHIGRDATVSVRMVIDTFTTVSTFMPVILIVMMPGIHVKASVAVIIGAHSGAAHNTNARTGAERYMIAQRKDLLHEDLAAKVADVVEFPLL